AARAGGGDDVGVAVAVDVRRGHGDAPGEAAEGEEAGDHLPGAAAVDHDVRPGAGACPEDGVGVAVVIDVGGGNEDAAAEAAVGGERPQLPAARPVERLDQCGAPGAGGDEDVGAAVVGDVADGDPRAGGGGVAVGEVTLRDVGGGVGL